MKLFEKISAKVNPFIQGQASVVGVKAAKLDPQRVPVSPAGSSNARAAGTVQQLAVAPAGVPGIAQARAGKPVSSYRSMIYEEYNRRTKPLEDKLKEIEAKEQKLVELGQRAQKNSNHQAIAAITESHKKLLQQKKKIQAELLKARADYEPDFNLVGLANDLDRADRINQGARLVGQLYGQLEAMVPTIDKAAMCYDSGLSIPTALSRIREVVLRELHDLRVGGVGSLRVIDKKETEARFNAALAEYERQLQERDAMEAVTSEIQ